MNTPTAKEIVTSLVQSARSCRREMRRSTYDKDYWMGMSRGYLSAARDVAHRTCGAHWLAARDRKTLRGAA